MKQVEDAAKEEAQVNQYKTEIKTLCDSCLLLELQLVDQLEVGWFLYGKDSGAPIVQKVALTFYLFFLCEVRRNIVRCLRKLRGMGLEYELYLNICQHIIIIIFF